MTVYKITLMLVCLVWEEHNQNNFHGLTWSKLAWQDFTLNYMFA